MLLDTHISMPSQDPLAGNKLSLLPRELRKWLKNLPYVDQDTAVQQFYDGLKRSNRQAHTTKVRLAAIEIMRPVAHEFLKGQRKYLLSQPFPLQKKATEVLKLQQNILNELAAAYKIIIQETINRDSHLSSKKLVTCVHRAMYYLLEQYITLAQVYSEPPQSFWHDLCQLYGIAEHFELTGLQTKNEIDTVNSISSPKILFAHACLLSLSNLHTYGHGEAGKIAAYLNKASHLTELTDREPESYEYAFYINLSLRKPARLISDKDIPISSKNRYIDATALVNELKEATASKNSDASMEKNLSDTLNKSLSKRLLNKLTSKYIRSSKRVVPTKGRLYVVIGMRDAIEILQTGPILAKDNKKSNFALGPIGNTRLSTNFSYVHNEKENSYPNSSANAWDWVSRGNVVSEQQEQIPNLNNTEKNEKVNLSPAVQVWDISNASKGGYCLNSSNTSDYQSQVGDIILIRLEDKPNDEWRFGVIRWMQSLSQQGVKMGIEKLHGSVEVMDVVNTHQTTDKLVEFDHVLKVTEQTPSGINKTIITPPNAAVIGDNFELKNNTKTQNIVFQQMLEQTISFARFSYSEMPVIPNGDQD